MEWRLGLAKEMRPSRSTATMASSTYASSRESWARETTRSSSGTNGPRAGSPRAGRSSPAREDISDRPRSRGLADHRVGRHHVPQELGRSGPGEHEALGPVAPEPAELVELAAGLDPRGHHAQAEGAAQADDGRDDRGVLGVLAQPVDERPVDLQHVDREPLEVAQGGVTGAEVVDGETHPEG